jgi:GlpG protein
MRLIGTIANENQAQKIILFLQSKGIDTQCEPAFEAATGYMDYHLWVINEDQFNEAKEYFLTFQQSPSDPLFDAAPPIVIAPPKELSEEEPVEKRVSTPLTFFFLGLSVFLFFWNGVEEFSLQQRGFLMRPFAMTSIQAQLMYDLPAPFAAFQEILQKAEPDQTFDTLSRSMQSAIQTPAQTSYWQGIYKWLILKIKGQDTKAVEGPLFTKIREGEIWRLFSPCVLHGGFLHILFNMLWLWVLGRPIEERIGFMKTFLLTLSAGIGSNAVQYLMSGPLFVGYSGIIMGLAAFIWMRQRLAPWEGYPLSRSTIYFLFLFIAAIFVLSLGSFFLQLFMKTPLVPNIANTAHIAGGIIGLLLARLQFFSARAAP